MLIYNTGHFNEATTKGKQERGEGGYFLCFDVSGESQPDKRFVLNIASGFGTWVVFNKRVHF